MDKLKQAIRILDVFYIGVILIWIPIRFNLPTIIKVQLIILGIGTILYNGYNFLVDYEKQKLIGKNKDRNIHVSDLIVTEQNLRTNLKQNYNLKLTY